MGFRSTFTTEDYGINWPEWFKVKYKDSIYFPDTTGGLSSKMECKIYGIWIDLIDDIYEVLNYNQFFKSTCIRNFIVVFLHECGGITRYQIEKDRIIITEPIDWNIVDGVTHNYCYGCSEIKE
jgi:hypothetical protein